MTRKEFVTETAKRLAVSETAYQKGWVKGEAVSVAVNLANELENQGEAPWMDKTVERSA